MSDFSWDSGFFWKRQKELQSKLRYPPLRQAIPAEPVVVDNLAPPAPWSIATIEELTPQQQQELTAFQVERSAELDAMLRMRETIIRCMHETFGVSSELLYGVVRTADEIRAKIEERDRNRRYPPTAAPAPHPVCCEEPMLPTDFGLYYLCRRCARTIDQYTFVNNNQRPVVTQPKPKWKPTVPHPLMQEDTSLERGKDFW